MSSFTAAISDYAPAERLLFLSTQCSRVEVGALTGAFTAHFAKMTKMDDEAVSRLDRARHALEGYIMDARRTHRPLPPSKILETDFFKLMQAPQLDETLYQRVLRFTIPLLRKWAQGSVPHDSAAQEEENAVNRWYARCLASYESPTSLDLACKVLETEEPATIGLRQKIGMELYGYMQLKEDPFTENDLDGLLDRLTSKPEPRTPDHADMVTSLHDKYVALFQVAKDPDSLREDIVSKLDVTFRNKLTL